MPPRKKTDGADEGSAAETDAPRRSTRIRDAPAKPPPAADAPAPKGAKRVKKDTETAEWKPVKKPAGKKRKKADVDAEENEAEATEGDDKAEGKKKAKVASEEEKPKKKVCPRFRFRFRYQCCDVFEAVYEMYPVSFVWQTD